MKTILQAGYSSVDEIDDVLVVGFADEAYDTKRYFLFQRPLDPEDDDGDGVYMESSGQKHGTYGTPALCSLSSGRMELTVDESTARQLGTETTFAVEFPCDADSLAQLKSGLTRIFAGTDCRLEFP